MHLPHPRIPPLSDAELTPAQREALGPASYPNTPPLNIFRTLAHAPEARTPFLAWGTYILRNTSLEPRRRTLSRKMRERNGGALATSCMPQAAPHVLFSAPCRRPASSAASCA